MPTAFKAFNALVALGLDRDCCHCIACEIEAAKAPDAKFSSEDILNRLCDGGIGEDLAEVLCDVLRNCFWTERFSTHFLTVPLKTRLVRSGLSAPNAEAVLAAIEPAVMTPRTAEVRAPIKHTPSPGRVVMCDFNYLRKPEMQKERRAIVISPRGKSDYGRCAVVPVTKKPSYDGGEFYFEFAPGSYPFFHRDDPVWAVCDHIYVVSLERLWKVNIVKKPELPSISDEELRSIRSLVGTALGHDSLTGEG